MVCKIHSNPVTFYDSVKNAKQRGKPRMDVDLWSCSATSQSGNNTDR